MLILLIKEVTSLINKPLHQANPLIYDKKFVEICKSIIHQRSISVITVVIQVREEIGKKLRNNIRIVFYQEIGQKIVIQQNRLKKLINETNPNKKNNLYCIYFKIYL
jgi:hypothetical protein